MTNGAHNHTADCKPSVFLFPEVATSTWTRLQPIASTVQHDLESLLSPVLDNLRPHLNQATQWTDKQLSSFQPWQVAVLAIGGTWLVLTLHRWVLNVVTDIRDVGKTLASCVRPHPICAMLISACITTCLVLQPDQDAALMMFFPSKEHALSTLSICLCAGVLQSSINTVKSLPILSAFVRREVDKVLVRAQMYLCFMLRHHEDQQLHSLSQA